MKREQTERDTTNEALGAIWRAQEKLKSLGVLFERQGEEAEGYTELAGAGMILTELGRELERVFNVLDQLSVIKRRRLHSVSENNATSDEVE